MMWFLLLLVSFFAHIEPASLQDKGRVILRSRDDPCEGYVEVYYNNKRGYVGDKFWSKDTEEVVCRSTHCGRPVGDSKDVYRPTMDKVWLNELKCVGEEKDLWECPGWPGPGASFYQKQTVKKIKCSNQIKMSLNGAGRCAGAVQYSTNGETPSGYICSDNWGNNEAQRLCQSLGCGGVKETPEAGWMALKDFPSSKNMLINCAGIVNPDNLWRCVTKEEKCSNPASVICEAHERIQLSGNRANVCSGELQKEINGTWTSVLSNDTNASCQQMNCGAPTSPRGVTTAQLTCTDQVKIVLTENCHGEVVVNVNGRNESVCASTWTNKEAEMVCKELNCGTVIISSKRSKVKPGIMDHVRCTGQESSLWHCLAKHDKGLQCSDSPYVMCSGSVDVKLVDGPGKCAGRLAVNYQGQWRRVQNNNWKKEYGDAICKHLECGSDSIAADNEEFTQGSGDFLTMDCNLNSKNISECFNIDQNRPQGDVKAVGIICKKHKVVFLDGFCSGPVGIERNGTTYWLSGSNKTWNNESANTVCQQMHCGNVLNYNNVNNTDGKKKIWKESYECSSTTKSLFDCKKIPRPSNHTVAHVTCSGKVNITLTKKCWGTVKICTDGQCGHVCADTWTTKKSSMLCKSLGCGDKALPAYKSPKGPYNIAFKSLHSTDHTTDLSQCNLVKNEDGDNTCSPAYVVCAASVKPRFKVSRDKCSGIVEVEYEGEWIPVQIKDGKSQNTTCKELKCGNAIKTLDYVGPPSTVKEVTELTCSEDAASLAACNVDVQRSQTQTSALIGLQCSDLRKMALESVCKGRVVVHSKEKVSAISKQGWTEKEGTRLCQDIDCGNFVSISGNQWRENEDPPLWNNDFSCKARATSIWDCESKTPTTHSRNQTLTIECEDRPRVSLTGNCQGEVKINDVKVCADHWNIEYAHMVCQEKNCSNAIVELLQSPPTRSEEMYHVRCDDHHYKLGQCERVKGPCAKGSVSISCIENVQFNTTEKCGGAIKVKYRNKWEKVCSSNINLSNKAKDQICEMIGCSSRKNEELQTLSGPKEVLQSSLICPLDGNDVRYCVKEQSCNSPESPAAIYCKGYKKPTPPPGKKTSPRWALIIIGVGTVLIVLIVVAVFVRSYFRRAGEGRLPTRMLPGTEDEFESGNYEDIMNKSNEMEDFSRGRFRSESEFIKEREIRGSSSFNYDDVDQENEVLPLTRPGFVVAGPRKNNTSGGVLNQSDGKF
ncbi:scavenger receptor cysteine-rich type 1 protein M130 [Odontesthes bonariensis]|uniref:scavenger receptor cysteine-rich type 1 protein M130 n=1 Tax=Odontesthes bonariensis TaxID=219752 RepID=UPI003F584FE3